jgi:thiamine-monophosphate kinase
MTGADNEKVRGMARYELIDHLSAKTRIIRGETDFGTATIAGEKGLLVSSDIMLEGTDFNLMYFPLKHLGYKSVIRAIAGIYASGGKPSALSFIVGMSSRFGSGQAEELASGILMAAKKYNTEIRYFDFVSSVTGLTISTTAWGYRKEESTQSGRPAANDLLCVTGDLGAAFMGLQVLERERRIFENGRGAQPDLSGHDYIIGRQLKPELEAGLIEELVHEGISPVAATVVREGLASEALGLCRMAGLGCRIFYDRIPIDQETHRVASEMNIDPVVAALNGGDDYEFILIVPLKQVEAVNRIKKIKMVGYLTEEEEGCCLITPDNQSFRLEAQGWIQKGGIQPAD